MPGDERAFADSNILLYAISDQADKKACALDLLRARPAISLQVINECSNVLRRKQQKSFADIQIILDSLLILTELVVVNLDTVRHAWRIGERYGYSYYDSLIIASALAADCAVLYSEDLQSNQRIAGVLRIVSPFRALTLGADQGNYPGGQ